jgi:RimJ/RimL family protein N-acetyltransferase
MIPTLTSERLVLRPYRGDDLADYAAMWADENVVRHIGGRAFTRQESWSKLLRNLGHWQLLDFGYWVLEERGTGRFVGETGFADFQRGLPEVEGRPEMGWVLASWAHGKGFATEAVTAAKAWGAAHLSARETVCIIDVGNDASVRVAEKCGFHEVGRTTYHETPVIVLHAALQ